MRTFVLITLFLLTTNVFAARIPTNWRVGVAAGYSQLSFNERRNSLTFPDVEVDQSSYVFDFSLGYFLIAPGLQFKGNLHILSPNSVENFQNSAEQQGISFYEGDVGITWNMFTLFRLFSVSLESEYFYSTTFTQDDTFGYKALSGFQLYPSFQLRLTEDDGATRFSIYSRIPLISDVGNREEITVGMIFWLPLGGSPIQFPLYAFENTMIVKITYSSVKIDYTDPSFFTGAVELSKVYASIGFNF